MPRVLITGGAGYLGSALIRSAPAAWQCHATWRTHQPRDAVAHRCDLADGDAVERVWDEVRPDLVIHTAYSLTAREADIWFATRNVADASAAAGAALIHLSTDLVLDGERAPYAEDAAPSPIHDYGRWKAKAELYVRDLMPMAAVVRTSLITSFDPPDPRTEWVVRGLRGESPVTLFADEIRCPIIVDDLVQQIWEIAALPLDQRAGVWHLAGAEALSRFALGALIATALGLPGERLGWGLSRGAAEPRPRDLRLLTSRADRMLSTRARPISLLAGGAPSSTSDGAITT